MKQLIGTFLFIIYCTALHAQWDKKTIRSVTKTQRDICASTGDSFDFHYEVSYPFFSNSKITHPITDSLNFYVRQVAGNNLMDSNFSSNLISLLKKESDTVFASWSRDLRVNFCYTLENIETIDLIYSNKMFSTLINRWYAYDGGAHGLSGEDFLVLDSKTGRRINSWKQLFVDTNKVFQLAKNEFYELKKREQCDSADWFWEGEFYVSDNFGILKEGILFYYQSYEIAPYALGPTELFLSWDILKKCKPKKKIN